MRSFVLFLLCLFCLSGAAFFGARAYWQPPVKQSVTQARMSEVAVTDKAYEQGAFLNMSDLVWIKTPRLSDPQDFVQKASLSEGDKGSVFTLTKSLKSGQLLEPNFLLSPQDPNFLNRTIRRNHALVDMEGVKADGALAIGDIVDVFVIRRLPTKQVILIIGGVRILENSDNQRFLEVPQSHLELFLTAREYGDIKLIRANPDEQVNPVTDPMTILQQLKEGSNTPVQTPLHKPRVLQIHRGDAVTTIPLEIEHIFSNGVIRRLEAKRSGYAQ